MLSKALLLGSIAGLVAAQFPPPLTGVKTLKSKFHENVTISYKEVCLELVLARMHVGLIFILYSLVSVKLHLASSPMLVMSTYPPASCRISTASSMNMTPTRTNLCDCK